MVAASARRTKVVPEKDIPLFLKIYDVIVKHTGGVVEANKFLQISSNARLDMQNGFLTAARGRKLLKAYNELKPCEK